MTVYKLKKYSDPVLDRQIEEICRCIRNIAAFGTTDVAITVTGTADGTYSSNEQTMINALAADMATLRDEINDLKAILSA